MKAKDVMTVHVVSVAPETSVIEIAKTLMSHRISAVPVLDDKKKLVGIVSEGDLLHRVETDTDKRHRSWWLSLFSTTDREAMDYVKSHGKRAADVMTRDVITVDENATLSDVAEILERRRIKRVPVLSKGALVGIVSRANLVQGLAALRGSVPDQAPNDVRIRDAILGEIRQAGLGSSPSTNMIVTDGVVELWGAVTSEAEKRAWQVATENVAGVKKVIDHRGMIPKGYAAF